MLFKSSTYTQVSGSVGGLTYSHNAAGMYTRARAVPINPNSPAQVAVRNAVAYLVDRWMTELTPAQRAAWETYAANVPLTGPLGDSRYVSGLAHYIRSNATLRRNNTAAIDAAPTIYDLGLFTGFGISTFVAGPPSTVTLTFTDTDDWHAAGGYLTVFASRPQAPTVNFFAGPYRQMSNTHGTVATPVLLVPLPFNAAVGQRLFFRGSAVTPDGRLSADYSFRLDT